MQLDFAPRPHEEAAALIAGKPAVTRAVFDRLLPELRARAFTISGVEGANVMQHVRDAIAGLPRGGKEGTWDKVKQQVADELYELGDQAERRAELLIRTHGFQAFQASNWRVAQEDTDTTHLQYLTMEDENVRPAHAALDGVILPKDDPFWDTHTPPWDWGCRCRIRAMNPDLVDMARAEDETRPPEDRSVIEGPALEQLRHGTLMREGKRYDVTPPSETREGGFKWHPDDLRLPLDELEQRYDPEVWDDFKSFATSREIAPRRTLMDWLENKPIPPPTRSAEEDHAVRLQHEVGVAYDRKGNVIARRIGSETGITWSPEETAGLEGGTLTHNHPSGLPPALYDYRFAVRSGLDELRISTRNGIWSVRPPAGGWGGTRSAREALWEQIQGQLRPAFAERNPDAQSHHLVVLFRQVTGASVTLL